MAKRKTHMDTIDNLTAALAGLAPKPRKAKPQPSTAEHGGPRPGSGRKALPASEKAYSRTVRAYPWLWELLARLCAERGEGTPEREILEDALRLYAVTPSDALQEALERYERTFR